VAASSSASSVSSRWSPRRLLVSRLLGDEAAAFAALALAGITAFYALETRELVGETHRTADEMRAARQEESTRARFERSREHAISVREAIRATGPMHSRELTPDAMRHIFDVLDRHGALIAHAALRERIRIARIVAFTASWPDDQYKEPWKVRMQGWRVAEAVQTAVERYLREEPLDPWPHDYPLPAWAQPWTIAGGEHEPDETEEKEARAAFDTLAE
jgi:hypothetical protein